MHKFDSDQFRQFMRLLQLGDPEAVIELRALASVPGPQHLQWILQ